MMIRYILAMEVSLSHLNLHSYQHSQYGRSALIPVMSHFNIRPREWMDKRRPSSWKRAVRAKSDQSLFFAGVNASGPRLSDISSEWPRQPTASRQSRDTTKTISVDDGRLLASCFVAVFEGRHSEICAVSAFQRGRADGAAAFAVCRAARADLPSPRCHGDRRPGLSARPR
ncbi:hypothetical protein EVAR_83073_1 [Eumeta japonica]|uniref:Uncharacterized protein n=1 Tax=Eumeta variegata TaxID=151549 RepID=A0A4C1VLM6_EUMVA|nr:hypothetical protein EVAR_83073_1 [Eumeta japonica]